MVERLTLEPEVQEILAYLDSGEDFLLSGGAGSGKTHSLIHLIKQIVEENKSVKIACITYTNAAVKEIEGRVNHKNLRVSTIHDFLWDSIKMFDKELKESLILLMNDSESGIKGIDDSIVPTNFFQDLEGGIQYKEYLQIKNGIISHDEVLILAHHMFKTYPKLGDILKDKFQYIFIDEYQDTSSTVVEIFLNHLKRGKRKTVIGFFGDSMQSIYEDGIGNIDLYKGDTSGMVHEVKKSQNRRNPESIIKLANTLRTDGITQVPSVDNNAPNMEEGIIKSGSVKFYYSSSDNNISTLYGLLGWNLEDSKEVKILNLTHNLIAPKAKIESLMAIYDKDPVIKLKNDILSQLKTGKITITIGDADSFDQVVNKAGLKNRSGIFRKDELLGNSSSKDLYDQLKYLPFNEVKKIYLDKDAIIDDKKQNKDEELKKGSKRDNLIKHLFKIQENIYLYENRRYNEFLRKTDYRIGSIKDKLNLREKIEELSRMTGSGTIEEIINEADVRDICKKDDRLMRFIAQHNYVYNRVKKVQFSEFQNLYNYLEGYTPFSTQHKTKGSEFNKVLVLLDNGGWNNYNFSYIFCPGGASESVLERTRKLFYVCCTRSKEELAIFFSNPSTDVISKVKELFGEECVIKID